MPASPEDLKQLELLFRENVAISEQSQAIYKDDDIITKVAVLQGVVKHMEEVEPVSTQRSSRESRAIGSEYDGPSDSPGPSAADNKLLRKHAQPRTSSQPPRDNSINDDKDEKESKDVKGTKITFLMGEEVAFKRKMDTKKDEYDWIQGIVTKVIGEGKSRRYDVQDPFPDDPTKPGVTYRSSASSMAHVQPVGTPLPDYENGKVVLALYPETSTFYKAVVKATLDDGAKVRLLFDGEEQVGAQYEVDRRFVLDQKY